MQTWTIGALSGYPGRGLVVISRHDAPVEWIYFVTGRSPASRQRRVRRAEFGLVIEPTNEASSPDALRHYSCARTVVDGVVVGNGDHVDHLADQILPRHALDAGLATIEPEPDPPICTPRIALVVTDAVSCLIAVHQDGAAIRRRIHPLDVRSGAVAVLTTYDGDAGSPQGTAPLCVGLDERSLPEVADAIWSTLAPDRRVLLVAGRGDDLDDVDVLN